MSAQNRFSPWKLVPKRLLRVGSRRLISGSEGLFSPKETLNKLGWEATFDHNPSFRRKPESIAGASQYLPGAARVYALGVIEIDAGSAAGMTGRPLWFGSRRLISGSEGLFSPNATLTKPCQEAILGHKRTSRSISYTDFGPCKI